MAEEKIETAENAATKPSLKDRLRKKDTDTTKPKSNKLKYAAVGIGAFLAGAVITKAVGSKSDDSDVFDPTEAPSES